MLAHRRALLLTGLMLACAAFPVRFRYEFGFFRSVSIFEVFLLLTPIWLLVVNWERPHRLAIGERMIFAVLALPLLLATMSLVWSENPAQTLYYIVQTLLAIAAYLLAVNVLQNLSPKIHVRCLAVLLMAAVVSAVMGFFRVPGFGPDVHGMGIGSPEHLDYLAVYYTRLSHPYWGLSNAFAGVLVFFVPIMLGWGISGQRKRYISLTGILLIAVCFTLSRGAILAILVALLICLLFWPRRRFTAIGAGLVSFSAAGLSLWAAARQSTLIREHIVYRLSPATVEIRLQQFARSVALIKESPLLGYGAGVVPHQEELLAGGVHNTFLQTTMELGIPLGLTFSGALFLLAALLLLQRGPFSATEPTMTVAVGGGLLAALLVFLTQAQFEGVLLRILFYMGMGFASALLQGLPRRFQPLSCQKGVSQ